MWRFLIVISTPESVRQEDGEFEASLSYAAQSCIKQEQGEKKQTKKIKEKLMKSGGNGWWLAG